MLVCLNSGMRVELAPENSVLRILFLRMFSEYFFNPVVFDTCQDNLSAT